METPKIKIVGQTLHSGQLEIVKNIINSPAMYHTICTSRQFGKSVMAVQLLLYFALNERNIKIMFTTPVYSQCAKVYKELLDGVRDAGIIKKFNSAENSIILVNGSEIYFKSVQVPDNLRGLTLDYLICDEAAMYKDSIFDEILRPMLLIKGKKAIICSTPKGLNWFHKMYSLGMNPDEPRYAAYNATYRKNPYANMDEINDARKSLIESIYKQEYEAQFIQDGGSVFGGVDKVATIDKWTEPNRQLTYYGGIDIAVAGDYFVVTIIDNKGNIVYSYRDNKKSMQYMLDKVKGILNKYNPRSTLVETNGVGNGIYDYISRLHKSVNPFVTTNDSKQEIIEDLIYAVQEQEVHIPTKEFFPYYIDEMNTFSFTYSPKTRKIIYGGLPGCHDDTTMSLAICWHAKKTGLNRGNYNIMTI